MEQIVNNAEFQFDLFNCHEVDPPVFAPQELVADFETELDAINYSVNEIIRRRAGFTQMGLAADMRITRSVMTKMRQGQAAVPVFKFISFVEHTRSYALLQFYAMRLGLVVKPRRDEEEDQKKILRLESELERERLRFKRAVGG